MASQSRDLRVRFVGDASSLNRTFASLNKSSATMGQKMSAVGGTMTRNVTLPILAMGAAAVATEASFSKSMNMVQASTGATGREMKALSDLAMQMGADTVFSANDAANAMLELSKGGMTQAQISAGALEQTLTLASAGSLELADAATYMTNAMSMFNLEAKDADQIAAALAGGANASTASVESLGLALSQVGPGATRLGLSLQETTGVLAAFEQAGIKGSDAGTSMKTFLARLVPTTDKAREAMKRLGLDFFDAEGNFVGIANTAEQLKTKLGPLSQEQRELALNTMFGSDASRAAAIIMGEGAGGIEKWTRATSDANAAQEMADATMKGTAGALESLKGSIETAGLAFGQVLAPMVESAAKWLASVANAFTNLSPEAQRMITIVLGITAAVGPLLIILGKFASAITAIKTLMAGTALANPWFLLAAAVVAVAALIIANWDKIKAWVMPILLAIKDVALAVWDAIKGAALAVADAFVAAWNWIKEAVMTVWGVIKGIAQAYIAVYVAAFKVVAGVFKVAWAVISAIVKAVWAVIRGIAKAYFALWRGVFTVVKTVALTVWNAIKGAVAAAWAVIRGIAVALKAFWVGVFNGIRTVASSVWQAIAGFFGTLWDRLRGIGTNIKQFFIDVWNTVKAKASGIWDAITEAFRGAINAIIGLWNRLDFSIDFTLPDVKYVPGLDGQHISTPDLIPDIPYLAKGGRIIAAGLAVVGERGPELVGLSAGATVAPVGAGGGGGPMRIELNLDRRRYGRAMELTFLSGRRG